MSDQTQQALNLGADIRESEILLRPNEIGELLDFLQEPLDLAEFQRAWRERQENGGTTSREDFFRIYNCYKLYMVLHGHFKPTMEHAIMSGFHTMEAIARAHRRSDKEG